MSTDTAGGPSRGGLRPDSPAERGDDPRSIEAREPDVSRSRSSPIAAGWSSLTARLVDPGQQVSVALLVVSLGLVPVALLPSESPVYSGMANGTPTFYTYTAGVVLAGVVVGIRAPRRFGAALLPWAPFFGWLVALTIFSWDPSPRTFSGLLHLCLGAVVFAVGATHARERAGSWFGWLFAAVAWLQLLAIVVAVLGHPLRRITGAQALDVLGRATGLTSHPGELSKLLFFCGLCALTLPQRTVRQRWAAWLTLGAVFAGVYLTQSRTVLVAVISMVAIFLLLELAGGRWQRKHFVVLGITFVLGLASLPWLIERFMADPSGGARQHVAQVAQTVIQQWPWTGVGPNGYVAVVGAFDRLTQTGVPVHNIFLLSAAELGIAGAVFLWLPFAVVAVRTVRYGWRTRGTDPASRIILSALPGIVLIAVTGWGLLQGPYFLIFCLVLGYFGARIGVAPPEDVDDLD